MREFIDGSTGDHRRDGLVMTEHVLGGGNVAAGVVRVGDTVRKPAGFWTPAVDALPWARLHAEGHGEHWTAAADYIERNLPSWRRALR